MTYPLVHDLAAEGIPVRLTCGVLGFSPQAHYAWLAAPISPRDLEDAHLINALIDAHSDDPEFGYRFLADELQRAGLRARERRGLAAVLPAEAVVHHGAQGPPGQRKDARPGRAR
jgi:putative transposase